MADEEEERWPFRTRVLDVEGRYDYVKVGAENGMVLVESPPIYRMGPDEADMLDLHLRAAADRARRQRQESQR